MKAKDVVEGQMFKPQKFGPAQKMVRVEEAVNSRHILIEDSDGYFRIYRPDTEVPGTDPMSISDAIELVAHALGNSAYHSDELRAAWSMIRENMDDAE